MKGEKMRKRRIIQTVTGLILSLTLIAGLGIGAFADEETGEAVDPERWMPLEEYEIIPGTAFEFVDSTSQEALMSEAQEYPAAYDLRELGYITPVRSQYPHGTCWGFAAMAAAESSLLSSGIAAEDGYDVNTLNLSEKYLVISAYTPFLKEGHPQNGEGFTLSNTPHSKLNRGGNATQASVGISTGFGIVHENSNPEYAYRGREGTREYAIIDGVMSPFGYTLPISYLEKTLEDAEVTKDEISDIILIGGSTKIPKIKDMLKNFFNKSELHHSIEPNEAVVIGATIQSAIIDKINEKNNEYDIKITNESNLLFIQIKSKKKNS